MKQIVILSGKGGTGKTSLTAAFAHQASLSDDADSIVLADADVDAANLELVLQPCLLEEEGFRGGKIAFIDQDTCASCGGCQAVCRFDAIINSDGVFQVDQIACEGCAACFYQCLTESISMQEQVVGQFFASGSRFGPLFHANLYPGGENSGKLVTLVKQRARLMALDESCQLVLVDGPPGIGCPVISATSGADMVLIVAEPTVSGVHDMRRVLETVQHFGVEAMVCINKSDLYPQGTEEIAAFCQSQGIALVGKIPFDVVMSSAMVKGKPVTEYRPEAPVSLAIAKIWERVVDAILQD
jgi:MinD superfamily P-loop ATPase